MLYLQIASPKSSVLNFLDSNSFEVIISIFQRTEKVPDMERLPLSYDGAESPEPQSQGSNTAKAHLIFVQNIDFLCLLSGQIHSRCYSLSERCFLVCDVSTGGFG